VWLTGGRLVTSQSVPSSLSRVEQVSESQRVQYQQPVHRLPTVNYERQSTSTLVNGKYLLYLCETKCCPVNAYISCDESLACSEKHTNGHLCLLNVRSKLKCTGNAETKAHKCQRAVPRPVLWRQSRKSKQQTTCRKRFVEHMVFEPGVRDWGSDGRFKQQELIWFIKRIPSRKYSIKRDYWSNSNSMDIWNRWASVLSMQISSVTAIDD